MPSQTRKGRLPVAEQSFGIYNVCVHTIIFELNLSERERKNVNKIETLHMIFLNLLKVSGTYTVDLAIE